MILIKKLKNVLPINLKYLTFEYDFNKSLYNNILPKNLMYFALSEKINK